MGAGIIPKTGLGAACRPQVIISKSLRVRCALPARWICPRELPSIISTFPRRITTSVRASASRLPEASQGLRRRVALFPLGLLPSSEIEPVTSTGPGQLLFFATLETSEIEISAGSGSFVSLATTTPPVPVTIRKTGAGPHGVPPEVAASGFTRKY